MCAGGRPEGGVGAIQKTNSVLQQKDISLMEDGNKEMKTHGNNNNKSTNDKNNITNDNNNNINENNNNINNNNNKNKCQYA